MKRIAKRHDASAENTEFTLIICRSVLVLTVMLTCSCTNDKRAQSAQPQKSIAETEVTAPSSRSQPPPLPLIKRGGWVSGYFPSWSWTPQSSKDKIVSMGCFTHVLFVCGSPTATGSFVWNANAEAMLADMVPVMRANGIKSVFQICCAGWDWEASARLYRRTFITNLLNVIARYRMDGIDLDWEPIQQTHFATFRGFVKDLRDSMSARWGDGAERKLIVTYASPGSYPAFASPTYEYIDQINIQGYDLVSPGWSSCSGNGNDQYVVWHQGPCYAGTATCPRGNRMPNLNDLAQDFSTHGIPKNKLGISARWNGSVWRGGAGTSTGGVTKPLQTWTTAPTMWNDVPYYYWWADVGRDPLMDPRIHDVAAGATYISHDTAGSSNDYYISYDDGWACMRKVELVQDSLYGGVYVWTIDGGEYVNGRYPQADSLKASSTR